MLVASIPSDTEIPYRDNLPAWLRASASFDYPILRMLGDTTMRWTKLALARPIQLPTIERLRFSTTWVA